MTRTRNTLKKNLKEKEKKAYDLAVRKQQNQRAYIARKAAKRLPLTAKTVQRQRAVKELVDNLVSEIVEDGLLNLVKTL